MNASRPSARRPFAPRTPGRFDRRRGRSSCPEHLPTGIIVAGHERSSNRGLSMKPYRLVSRCAILWFAVVAITACASAEEPLNGKKTPLDEYVAKADPAYEWKVVKTIPGEGVTT